jgi:hypothetical protein
MGWGYHQRSLPENELEFKQFFTVVHVDSIDGGDETTVLELKAYFSSHAYRAGRLWPEMGGLLIQQSWTLFSTP